MLCLCSGRPQRDALPCDEDCCFGRSQSFDAPFLWGMNTCSVRFYSSLLCTYRQRQHTVHLCRALALSTCQNMKQDTHERCASETASFAGSMAGSSRGRCRGGACFLDRTLSHGAFHCAARPHGAVLNRSVLKRSKMRLRVVADTHSSKLESARFQGGRRLGGGGGTSSSAAPPAPSRASPPPLPTTAPRTATPLAATRLTIR